jgi:hypothetical protein
MLSFNGHGAGLTGNCPLKTLLAIGGGGMKGYVECAVLAEIEQRSGKRITQLFDLIAGTSVGAIIGCSLCAGNSASDTLSFFTHDGPNIFNGHFWTGSLMLLRGYRYDPSALESSLKARLGVRLIKDANVPLLVSSVDRNSKRAIFFKSNDPATMIYPMWQAARGSSAAQTYFPPYALNSWSLWDGGNACNNPAMCAYAEGISLFGAGTDIRLLSLGCGDAPYALANPNPGALSIIAESLGLLLESNDELPDYQLSQILGDNFQTIQPIGLTTGLDDASPAALSQLNKVAMQTIAANSNTIDVFCQS